MLKYVNLFDVVEKISQTTLPHYDSFEELPNTNPLVIADMTEQIVYSNQSFTNIFGKVKHDKITCLKTEPDIVYLLRTFARSNYSGIECELALLGENISPVKNFSVLVERIFVKGSEYLVLIFKAQEDNIKLEMKINNLNQALDYANIPIMIADSEGKISYATTFFDKILNLPIESLYNHYIYDVLAIHVNKQEKSLLTRAVQLKREWNAVIISEFTKEAQSYYELRLIPISTYDGGTNFILSGHDITQHIIKTQLVKKNETQLRSIINNISDLLLLIKYKNGKYIFEDANENFCRIFSIDKKNSKSLNNVLKDNFGSMLLKQISNFNRDKENHFEFRYSDNQRHYTVKVSYVINSMEEEIIYIASLSDITDQLLSQEQLKKAYEKENHFNNLKSSILKNMSHEIRTPLNALIGYSEIIEEGLVLKDYSVLSELTHSLRDILNRILNLFSNIVEVSQIESNEFELELYVLDVNKILKSVFNKKHTEALNKKIDFNLVIPQKEIHIRIDWIKMEKVIFALVDNAIKYTSTGSVVIKSEIINNQAVISIVDSGIGMPKERIKSLIQAFMQAEEGYTKYFEGAGLGLTLAYNYVEKMGGKFFIESELDKGTFVQLVFPVQSSLE